MSAGADPGPACYGRGGTQPTVTDADLVLGYVPADFFLGGEIELDADAARSAIASVAEPLGMDVPRAAEAIFTTVNSYMADQITEVATTRGYDVRDFTLVVGGGAGPVHAAFIADLLHIPTRAHPARSPPPTRRSACSRWTSDGTTRARTSPAATGWTSTGCNGLYDEMEREATAGLRRAGRRRRPRHLQPLGRPALRRASSTRSRSRSRAATWPTARHRGRGRQLPRAARGSCTPSTCPGRQSSS